MMKTALTNVLAYVLFLSILLMGAWPCAAAAVAPTDLSCQLLEHPEETVITTPTPKFGWIYNPSFRNDSQTGYQVIVASSQALAGTDTGDLWDSGLVSNSTSINVPYGGAALQPNTNYFWRVRTMDSTGDLGDFSGIQQFNMAAQLSDPLTNPGVIYQLPSNGSTNCYPLRFVSAAPVLVTNTAPGTWFIDFGQDAFGYATVHLNGNFSGTNVQASFGELASGLSVNTVPPGTLRYGASTFTLTNGDLIYPVRPPSNSGQTITPPSSYGVVLPFRYFQLINCPGTLTSADVVQQRLISEFNTNAASFSSSSTALNQVWNLCRNSMQWLTFDGIYVDGDRERKPYEADASIQQMSSYGVDREFTMPRCSFEYLTTNPTWPTEWPFHMVFIAWADYQQTGDTYLMTKYYNKLVADCLTNRARSDGLIQGFTPGSSSGDIIDWPSTDRDSYVWENYDAELNAFYYRCMTIMTQAAQLTGHNADAATFATNAANVYNAFNTNFWNWSVSTNSYIDGIGTTHSAAHASFFPLAFGLVPTTNQAAVDSFLHTKAAVPWSVYGAQYLLEGLFQYGDADYALRLMSTNSTRSWQNMLRAGSTLTTEAWSFADKSNEDWNHAWGSAPGNIIPRYVLGLRPLTAGYGQILIQPQLGAQTLSYVQGTIPTIRGPVSIQVTNGANIYQMSLTIPGNVTATVMLPSTNSVALVDGNLVSGTVSNGWLTLTNIGSGQHDISRDTTLPPVANFTATPTSGVEPLPVVFTDLSSNAPTSWAWDFDNNGTTDSTAQSPTHAYSAGTYSVKLIACNAAGCSTNTQVNYIAVITVLQSWQDSYGVAPDASDPFGVGLSNTNKFLAGFNPTVAGAYPRIISITVSNGTDMAITYLGSNGDTNYPGGPMTRTNVLEFAAGTADGSYTNSFASTGLTNVLSGGIGFGTNVTVTELFGATNSPARYYRVRVLVP